MLLAPSCIFCQMIVATIAAPTTAAPIITICSAVRRTALVVDDTVGETAEQRSAGTIWVNSRLGHRVLLDVRKGWTDADHRFSSLRRGTGW